MSAFVLRTTGLKTTFPTPKGDGMDIVDGLDLHIRAGETLAIVGESGCGKSMTALSLMRLVPKPGKISAGRITIHGHDIRSLPVSDMRRIRGRVASMIFQEPMTSLNAVMTVGSQVAEAILLHQNISKQAARERVIELFELVGIPDPKDRVSAYPHQLSGGLKQRVMIAMALSTRPKLLIADEPTTALDVTIQAQILRLLQQLQAEMNMAILLITHDLGVVNAMADRIAVMYAGKIIERGSRQDILKSAKHPYTQGLLAALPSRVQPGQRLTEISGIVPSPDSWTDSCRFANRCTQVIDICRQKYPEAVKLSDQHSVACHIVKQADTEIVDGN